MVSSLLEPFENCVLIINWLPFSVCLTTISTIHSPQKVYMHVCICVCGLRNGINIVVFGLEGEVSPLGEAENLK